MPTIPGDDAVAVTRRSALSHVARGWSVFLLATDGPEGKIPPKNCARCDVRTGERHDRETCKCLLCHGFYAATQDQARLEQMIQRFPTGYLAVRTGTVSRLLVLDVEAKGVTEGVLDSWEQLTRCDAYPAGVVVPHTLTATSVSGGRHLYLSLPEGVVVRSGRILPDVDVKAEGGLVGAVGSRSGKRVWLDETVPVAPCPPDLLAWLSTIRRSVGGSGGGGSGQTGHSNGYDYRRFEAEGCPGGYRDEFFNDLLFRARKNGADGERLWNVAREHWERCGQPGKENLGADWFMPWENVLYKIERIFHEIEVNQLTSVQAAFALIATGKKQDEIKIAADGTRTRRVGRVTVIVKPGGSVWP